MIASSSTRDPPLRRWGWLALALVLVIVGSRWDLVHRHGTDVPEWDQWDAEGVSLLLPWTEGRFSLSALLTPHNEHRVVPSKTWALTLTLLNGQWDQRLLCVANALLPAALVASLWWFGRRFLGAGGSVLLALSLMAAWALPHSWHNTLSGFHSQQFFLLGFSSWVILGFSVARTGGFGWWTAFWAVPLAVLSMGSGLLAPAAALVVLLLRHFVGREGGAGSHFGAVLWCVGWIVVGWWSRVIVPGHADLQATSLAEFLGALSRALRWPLSGAGFPWWWLPWTLLVGVALARWRQRRLERVELALLGLGLWVLLQQVATAYVRGAGAPEPAVRYLDTVMLGHIVNVMAALRLVASVPPRRRRLAWTGVVVGLLVWLALLAAAARRAPEAFAYLHDYHRRMEHNVRLYLSSGDAVHLQSTDLPYPDARILQERLAHPGLRALLPASIRPPLPLPPAEVTRGFAETRGPAGASRGDERDAPPPRPEAVVVGSTPDTVGRWQSGLFPAPRTGGVLVTLRGGGSGEPGRLEIQRADYTVQAVVSPRRAGTWEDHFVDVAPGPFRLLARDEHAGAELAFQPPVEISRGSWWSRRLAAHGGALWRAGLGLLLPAVVLLWWPRPTGAAARALPSRP